MNLRPILVVTAVLLEGCAQSPRHEARLAYTIDLQGQAEVCTAPQQVSLAKSQATKVAVSVTDDGGWCGFFVALPGPNPFDAGLLRTGPEHGKVYIHQVGDFTRIDYTPDRGFSGSDTYEVALLPGQPIIDVAVAVAPGVSVVPAAAPPPEPAPARPKPKRRVIKN